MIFHQIKLQSKERNNQVRNNHISTTIEGKKTQKKKNKNQQLCNLALNHNEAMANWQHLQTIPEAKCKLNGNVLKHETLCMCAHVLFKLHGQSLIIIQQSKHENILSLAIRAQGLTQLESAG